MSLIPKLELASRPPHINLRAGKNKLYDSLYAFLILAPKLDTGGKPSTWFPPGRLVEHIGSSLDLILPNMFNVRFESLLFFNKNVSSADAANLDNA